MAFEAFALVFIFYVVRFVFLFQRSTYALFERIANECRQITSETLYNVQNCFQQNLYYCVEATTRRQF